MNYKTIVDEINRRAYTSKPVLSWYRDLDDIQVPERAILEKILPRIKNQKLLDLSIGGGRSTRFLLPLSKHYVGIDYAPDLVDAAKNKYPEAEILCRDARDLTCFDSAAFDFALASNNGLDYMVHEDRLQVLREIWRLLKPGGLFMFSTHNRDYRYFDRLPWQQDLSFDLNYLKTCAHSLFYFPKHLKLKKHATHRDEYAMINDNAHGYSLLTYYISIEKQIAQLEQNGFGETEAYNLEGEVRESEITSPWMYYLTRKPAT
jgi:SAM-dependent methyltransferase